MEPTLQTSDVEIQKSEVHKEPADIRHRKSTDVHIEVTAYRPAGRWIRLLACLIDNLLIIPGLLLPAIVVQYTTKVEVHALMLMGVGVFSVLAVQAWYLTRDGQTVGKKVCKIKIVKNKDGTDGGFVRNFLVRMCLNYVLSMIPLYWHIDTLMIFTSSRRCLHDRIAGTKVVKIVKGGELYRNDEMHDVWEHGERI